MASLSQLIVKITGDTSGFERAIASAQRQAANMAEKFEAAGSVLTRALTLPAGLGAGLALKAAADFESLRRGLEAVTGSSEKAAVQFERLKKVAELPGLGFKEAVQGAINLQAAGFSANTAERALTAFGNALATVGKGRAELDGVILALSQIQSKGKFSAEELNQLAERLPQIRQAIKAAFGTASTEDIQKLGLTSEQIITKIIEQFEKLPQVTGGLRNSFENLRDNAERALAAIGEAIAPAANASIRAIEPLIAKAGELARAFAALPEPIQQATIALIGIGVAAGPILTVVSNLKQLEVALLAAVRVAAANPLVLPFIAAGGAIAVTASNLRDLEARYDSAADRAKGFQDRLKDPQFIAALKEQAAGVGNFGITLAKVAADAQGSGQALANAFSTLGMKSSADLRKELQAAQAALETIRQGMASGATDQNDYAAAAEKVRAIQEQLSGKLKETALNLRSIDFAAKSKENELFAASIAKIAKESDALKDQIVTLRAVGDAFTELAEGPALGSSVDAFARLVEGANKYNDSLKPIEERNLRFVESLQRMSTQAAVTGESLQNIKIPDVLQRAQEDVIRRTSAPFRSNTREITAFQRQVSTVLTDFSRGVAEAIVQGESLGQVFTKIGQQIQTALIRNAIEQGVKVLGRELGKLISQLGDVGRAIAGAFGGVAQSAGNVAGAASGAAGTAGSAAGSAAGIAAGGLAGTITAVSGIATAVFSALQFFQGRRMEQDIGRIEVSNREIASQTVAIQQRLDQWLPYLQNTAYLSSIDGTLNRIYEGLSQLDFSGFAGGGKSAPVTFNISNPDPKAVMQEISRSLRLQSKAFG